jgi:hypothetical protein
MYRPPSMSDSDFNQDFVKSYDQMSVKYDNLLFGFWPHITHVIVLTFKEIKHLSDYRTVGRSDCRIIGRTPKYHRHWSEVYSFDQNTKEMK